MSPTTDLAEQFDKEQQILIVLFHSGERGLLRRTYCTQKICVARGSTANSISLFHLLLRSHAQWEKAAVAAPYEAKTQRWLHEARGQHGVSKDGFLPIHGISVTHLRAAWCSHPQLLSVQTSPCQIRVLLSLSPSASSETILAAQSIPLSTKMLGARKHCPFTSLIQSWWNQYHTWQSWESWDRTHHQQEDSCRCGLYHLPIAVPCWGSCREPGMHQATQPSIRLVRH